VILSTVVGPRFSLRLENQSVASRRRGRHRAGEHCGRRDRRPADVPAPVGNGPRRTAGRDWYASIKRDIEQLRALRREERGSARTCTDTLRKEMSKAGQKARAARELV